MDEASADGTVGDRFVKVVFELPRGGDGWPPASSEGLWAVLVGPDVARVDNTRSSCAALHPAT